MEWRHLLAITFQPELPISASNSTTPNAVAGGDFDRDGDLDLVVASIGNDRLAWYENLDGQGTYGDQRVISSSAIAATTVHVADLDGDGDVDLLAGGASAYDSDVSWYQNDGQGGFSAGQLISADVQNTDSVFAADLDNDGDLDVLSASRGDNKVAWYENTDGLGSFGDQNPLTTAALGARTVAAADFDGDGDVDVVAGSSDDDSVWWFENLGGSSFSGENLLTDTADYVTRVTAADLDGDNRIDIVVSSRDDHTVAWMQNLGNGTFGPEQPIALDSFEPYGVVVTDVDGDGQADVAVADLLRDEVVWYKNLGNATFDVPRPIISLVNGPVSILLGDADGDGDLDAVAASRFDNQVSFSHNLGAGQFAPAVVLTELGFLGAQFVNSGDVDGDGDQDVLAASFTGDTVAWFENVDGQGTFGAQRTISTRTNGTEIALLADFDGDQDLDVATASFLDDKIAWYENLDGLGNFGPQRLVSGDNDGPEFLDVGDMDGDGDIDLISSSRYGGKIAWYENVNGQGTFGPQIVVWLSPVLTTFVRAADIDGDGDLDLVANDYYPANSNVSWFENVNGRGAFGNQNVITLDIDLPTEVDLADFDGDGDIDVVVASGNDSRLLWYQNTNGDGDFDQGRLISDTLQVPYSTRAVDFDGDGDFDVLAADLTGNQLAWFENEDGLGGFGVAQVVATDLAGPASVHTSDLDGDGDQDALVAISGADQILWYRNLGSGEGVVGDFNADGVVNAQDIDLLCGAIRTGGVDADFDLTADGSVNRNDINELVVNVLQTSFGDANLDGVFNSSDFVVVFQIGEYEDELTDNSSWADGDWNCDGEFSTADLVSAFQSGGFSAEAEPGVGLTEIAAAFTGLPRRNLG